MGCGNAGRDDINKKTRIIADIDLYREAYGCDLKVVPGYRVNNDDRRAYPNIRLLNKKYGKIKEELIELYEEKDAVKPWMCQIAVFINMFNINFIIVSGY